MSHLVFLGWRIPCAEMAVAGIEYFLGKGGFLDLYRCMIDPEHLACDSIDSVEKVRAIGAVARYDMTTHGQHSGGKGPHMKIMNGSHAVHAAELFPQAHDVDMRRRALQ